jgi:dTDP-4-dehydrorhamnose reductase
MTNVVILGDGILGTELHNQTGWNIVSRKNSKFNINDYDLLLTTIDDYDVVVNCIANTDSYSDDKEKHWDVNYRFASDVSDSCLALDKKLVHISTEFVYANNTIPPTEEDLPIPDTTWYAYTKLLADEYIKLTNKNYLICRELHKKNDFNYENVWDVKTSGDLVKNISKIIIQLIEKNASGVYNVGTGDKNLIELNEKANLIKAPSHVPTDTRMNLDKLNNFLNE